eukprot:c14415_g1_i1 orf=740-1681(-)
MAKQRSLHIGASGPSAEPQFLLVAVSDPVKLGNGVQAYISYRINTKAIERAKAQEGNMFQKRSGDFMQMFKGVQSKVTDIVLGKDKLIEESDPDYEKLKHYVLELEDHLGEAQKQSLRLAKRHKDLGQAFLEFGKAIKALGNCEGADIGRAFTELGCHSDLLSSKLGKHGQELMLDFEEPLKEYVRTVQSIKAVMANRALAFRQQRELTESARLKELNLEKFRVVQPHKVFEAEADLEETLIQSEEARKRFEMIVKSMQHEMVRFQEQRTQDLRVVFQKFAQTQAQLANDTADAWRMLLPKLENPLQSTYRPS